MKRRSIGPAFERCPAEKINDWGNRSVLTIISCIAATFGFWAIVIFVVDYLAPLLYRGADESVEISWNSNDAIFVAVKIVGAMILCYLIARSRKSR
ncbi:MAG TPA: hypothetical protein DCR55_00865 [Lentisphaeria bacterium]|nr:hypothetical protein [Lentisphaeria bacterium]